MKNWLTLLGLTLVLFSCETQSEEPAMNTIMPLGASRVEGSPPGYHSYRYKLWKKLRNNEWNIDFHRYPRLIQSLYPMVNDEEFDPHPRRTQRMDLLGSCWMKLSDWTAVLDTPDIVLFSSPGGNDALDGFSYESIMVNVVDIVEGLQEFNPEVTIIIEKMAPGHSAVMMGNLAVFHARLLNELDSIASALSTSTSQVLTIDMATGFTDDMLADPIHYNQDGATFIAKQILRRTNSTA